MITQLWLIIAEKGIYQIENSLALARASKLLHWSDVVAYTTDIVSVSAIEGQQACISLLTHLCNNRKPSDRQQLDNAATLLFAALPGDKKRFPELNQWQQQRMALTSNNIADVIMCFSLINVDLAEKMLGYMLAWPVMYGMDELLLPAALQLAKSKTNNELPTVERLRQQAITHLQTRLALPLEPPADWSRDNPVKCSCADCCELKRFLISPKLAKWSFKAVEARRSHIQHAISMSKCDVDYITQKKSRPYSMVCTKNQASYKRRVEQAQRDKGDLACLLKY